MLPCLRSEILLTPDPVQFAHTFYERKIISKEVYDKIVNGCIEGSEREELMINLSNGIADFSTASIPSFRRTVTKPGKGAYIRFRTIKRNIHNRVWPNPYEVLSQQAQKLKIDIEKENNPIQRQCLTDILIAHLAAEIDAISIKFDEQFFNHEIFLELQSLFQNSSIALIPTVIYLSRQANAYAIGGNFEQGEQLLSDAMQCAEHLPPCLELVNLYYLDVVFRLWKLEFYPSRELKSSLIEKSKTGLQMLKYENEDTRLYLTRMFFIRMASGLLGIGNRGEIYPEYNIEGEDIFAAKSFLAEVDKLWNGIEMRQEMFYSVARAKIYQLEGEIGFAKRYSRKALQLARHADFKEGKSIEKYCRELESQPLPLTKSNYNRMSERHPLDKLSIIQTSLFEQQTQNITSRSVEEISTVNERSFSSLENWQAENNLRFSTFSESSSQQNMDNIAQSTSVKDRNPSSYGFYAVGQSLSFSLLSEKTSGQSVHEELALDISSLDIASLFDEKSGPKILCLSEVETSVNFVSSDNGFVKLDISSLLNQTSTNKFAYNKSNQNADDKDSKHDTPNREAIDTFYIRNEELYHQTFNVDDIDSFELFQERCEPASASRMETEVITVFSSRSSDYKSIRNLELLTQQRMHNSIQRDNLAIGTANLEDVDSIVLFDRGEPEGN